MKAVDSELDRLYASHKRLTASIVVKAAKSPKSPLHSEFEWDDTVAGPAYRLVQAGHLIRRHKVRFMVGDEPITIRRWISTPDSDGQRSYTPAEEVAADEFTSALVRQEMERDWKALKRRWAHWQEFTAMVLEDLGAA